MLKIDNTLLQDIGLGQLPDAEKNSLLKHIYETLEMRVGMRLADQMSNQQLDEFEQYFEAKDDAGAFQWLESNFPNYKDIVQEEFDKLKNEVGQSAPDILAASQAQAAAGPAQPQAAVQPQPQPAQDFGAPAPQQYQQPPQPQPYTQPQPSYGPAPAAPQPGADYQQPAYPAPQGFDPQSAPAPPQPYAAPPTPQPIQPPQPYTPSNPGVPQPPEPSSPYPQQQPPAGPGA